MTVRSVYMAALCLMAGVAVGWAGITGDATTIWIWLVAVFAVIAFGKEKTHA